MGNPGFGAELVCLLQDSLGPRPPSLVGLSRLALLRFIVSGPNFLGRLLGQGFLPANFLGGDFAFPFAAAAGLLLLAGLFGARALRGYLHFKY